MVAGEVSGDLLGAGLIRALRKRLPQLQVQGVGGPAMQEAGCEVWVPAERLAVMGLSEVLGRLRELLALRRDLARRFATDPPDLFIGVDAPDFNLGLEMRLRRLGLPTLHYVSPSVWAWRRYRVRRIGRATDLVLTLFPFEEDFYREHGVSARYVGHPLADLIPLSVDPAAPRAALGLPAEATVVALLPGSRDTEVRFLAEDFIGAARWLAARRNGLHFVLPAATPAIRGRVQGLLAQVAPGLPVTLVEGSRSREAMSAANLVLTASGTAALEAMLLKRPMAVAYRLSRVTFTIVKALLRVPYYSLPNLLAGRRLVPEITQDEATPEALGGALLEYLDHPEQARELAQTFDRLHRRLRRDASERAAEAVLELLGRDTP